MRSEFTMKDMAECERPYEKCLSEGAAVLSDAELLAVILRCGSRHGNALLTAQKILAAHPVHKGIIGLNYLSVDDLMNVDGIGKVKAIQMQCIAELSRRMARSEHRSGVTFGNPKSIADYYMERTRYLCKEQVYVLMFDSSHHLLKECRLSEGTVDHAVVSPRDIFIDALKYQAVYIVLLHNHPSGNPEPSNPDILLTKRVEEAGKTLGIRLSDHIILGNNCFVSLAERGIIE